MLLARRRLGLQAPKPKTYTVQDGDTWASIATRFIFDAHSVGV